MATTLDQQHSRQHYADFDEYIAYQLQKTRAGIRLTDIFTALCGVAVLVVSYLLVFVIFDHWVVSGGFSRGMRIFLLSGLGLATAVWIGWKVVLPYFRRVNALYAARSLEQISPDLKSTLINYVDLRSHGREVPPEIIGSLEKRAAVTLSHTDVDDAVDRRLLLHLCYVLLAAVILFSFYVVFSPKQVWPSIVRILAPAAEVSVSTQTAFLDVDPGNARVLAREFLTVTTDVTGEPPGDVTLFFTTDDHQFVKEPVRMREVEPGLKRYRAILKGATGEGLLQNLSYYIEAGDAVTREYQVTVTQPPSATVASLNYDFPDYMEFPPKSPSGASIDTWEGTRIEIDAETNMPVEFAWLQLSDEEQFPRNCEEFLMEVSEDGTQLSVLWQPIVRDDGSHPRFYRIQCKTKGGHSDPAPSLHSIELRQDQKPEISLVQPSGDIEVAANAIVPLLLQVRDPDFRLSQITLHLKPDGRTVPRRVLYEGSDRDARVTHDLKIADLNVEPGDVITWWAEARDNRRVESTRRVLLDGNLARTPKLRMTVQAPVSREEAKARHEFDKQRAEEKLDELEQPLNNQDDFSNGAEPRQDDRSFDSATENLPESAETDSKSGERQDQPQTETGESSGEGNGSAAQTGEAGEGQGQGDRAETSDESDGAHDGSQDGASDAGANGRSGKSAREQPVSNDGSQDDEVLRELMKRAREKDSQDNAGQSPGADRDRQTQQDSPGQQSSESSQDSEQSQSRGTEASDRQPGSDGSTDPDSPDSNEAEGKRSSEEGSDSGEGNNSQDSSSEESSASENPGSGNDSGEAPRRENTSNDSSDTPDSDAEGREPSDSDMQQSGNENRSQDSDQTRPEQNAEPGQNGQPEQSSQQSGSPEQPPADGQEVPAEQPSEGDSPPGSDSATGQNQNPSAEPNPGSESNPDSEQNQEQPADGEAASSEQQPPEDSAAPNSPDGSQSGGDGSTSGNSSSKGDPGSSSSGQSKSGESDSGNQSGGSGGNQSGSGGDSPNGSQGSSSGESSNGSNQSGSGSGKSGNGSDSSSSPAGDSSNQPGAGSPGSGERPASSGEEGDSSGGSDSGSSDAGSSDAGSSESGGSPAEGSPSDSSSSGSPDSGDSQSSSEGGGESGSSDSDSASGGSESGGSESGGSESGGSESGGQSGEGASGQGGSNSSGSGQSAGDGGTSGQGGGQRSGSAPGNPSQHQGGAPQDGSVTRSSDAVPDAEGIGERPGSGANISDPTPQQADKANLEDKLKASNMVLKRVKEQLERGEVDPELLEKLGWTEKDMGRFAERLERRLAEPKPDDPGAAARRRQFEEMLRSLDLESSGGQRNGDFQRQKSTSNFSDRRLPVPRGYKEAYERYLKRLSGQRRPARRGD